VWTAGGGWERLLGTDHLGRDLLSRLIVGARVSVLVAVISVAIAGSFGVVVGLLAGYFGGRIDALLMRLADMQLALPFILLATIIIGIFGPTLVNSRS
jgi:ABC-type dipeptide/oligopeptide/nickel transport system permease subunit